VRALWCALLFIAALAVCQSAAAQFMPDRVLAAVIRGFQTGQVNQSWFGQQLLQTIYQQTNGTFVYANLVQLGPVQTIQVVGEQPVPQGVIYNMRVFHANGSTEWQMGISRISQRIEYLAVSVTGSAPPRTAPVPAPTPPPTPAPRPPVTSEPQLKPLPRPSQPGPQPRTQPPSPPPAAGPPTPMPTPSATPPGGGTGGSEACKLYPNLC
jgi:hypothetical protein